MTVERRCLPIAAWPERDRLGWEAGTCRAGPFEKSSAGSDWSPHSRNKTARGYGRWLCWLRQKRLFDPTLTPGARVTRPLVADYVATLSSSCAPYTVVCRLQELYDALRVLAPDRIGAGSPNFRGDLVARASPARNKSGSPATRARSGRSWSTNDDSQPSKRSGWSRRRRAVQYRDGLMIALRAYRPVAPSELCLDDPWRTPCAAEPRMVAEVPRE